MLKSESRITSAVTRRGLEVTATTPNQLGSSLFGLFFFLAFASIFVFVGSDILTGDAPDWRALSDALFGRVWLWLGAAALVLMIAFARYSNEHYIFGRRTVERQHRIGRVVLETSDRPLSGIAEVNAAPRAAGGWQVVLVGVSRRRRNTQRWLERPLVDRPIAEADAVAAAARIRAWLEAPGSQPVETVSPVPAPVAAIEAALSLVTTRLTRAIPLLIGTSALLVLGFGWQHREAVHERAEPLPRLDRTANGELVDYRWTVGAPLAGGDRYSATVRLDAAVRYHDDEGRAHTLRLTTQPNTPIYTLGDGPMAWAVPWLGLPWIEFALPDWMRGAVERGEDWNDWRALARDPGAPAFDRDVRAAEILVALDEPFHYLLAGWSAPSEDWRVAFRSTAPRYAMPVRWRDAERAVLASVAPESLLPLGAIAAVIALLTLPGVLARTRRWRHAARAAVLLLVLAVPLWSHHAERVPGWLGIDTWLLDATAFVLRMHAPGEDAFEHTVIRRAWPARDTASFVTVRWTPERSASYSLLRALQLDAPPDAPYPDTAAAREALVARAESALADLDDAALTAFLAGYVVAGWERRVGPLHDAVVAPALCRVTGETRAVPSPVPCDGA